MLTTTTQIEEVEACLLRGTWYELIDPDGGQFYGRWLEPTGAIEEYRYRHLVQTGVGLQVCQVTRVSAPNKLPVRVRVANLERPRGWG
jgi:hypothetical protein